MTRLPSPFCWLARRRLGAFVDGELPEAARGRVAGHLARCPDCRAEREALDELRGLLRAEAPELPEAVWSAFWPQVRERIGTQAPPEAEPVWRRVWQGLGSAPRLAIGSAAAAVLAVLVVVAPWRPAPIGPDPGAQGSSAASLATPGEPDLQQVLVQSVETEDPQSTAMVFSHPESEVTVIWVFGLARTEES
jgi:anti-sigma factor RsiW